jgi:hypothetical protein
LSILLDGPTVTLYGPSDAARPVTFLFDPPWNLPKPGRYFFAVKENTCIAFFVLLTDSTDSYVPGGLWQITPSPGCEALGNNSNRQSGIDLVFTVDFCDAMVGAERRSWGRLKSSYR